MTFKSFGLTSDSKHSFIPKNMNKVPQKKVRTASRYIARITLANAMSSKIEPKMIYIRFILFFEFIISKA
jgi:hypothetical protein